MVALSDVPRPPRTGPEATGALWPREVANWICRWGHEGATQLTSRESPAPLHNSRAEVEGRGTGGRHLTYSSSNA